MLDINPLLGALLVFPAPAAVLVRHSIIRKGGLVAAVGRVFAVPVAALLLVGYTYPLALLAWMLLNF